MITAHNPAELAETIRGWKADNKRIGFVPTMGALHDGHLSLMRLAADHADIVVASIFVNPTQFAPHEDFDAYPRDVEGDLTKLSVAGIDLVYLPAEADIYPGGQDSNIKPGPAAEGLESAFRPHFFAGVLDVVQRLFAHVQPDIAVFGEKDYQQYKVIEESISAPPHIIAGPIARDEHGLALSSRNAYLSTEELEIARMLNQIIYKAAFDIQGGADSNAALKEAKDMLLTAGFDKVDYIEQRWGRILAAVWLGKTRLIDNAPIETTL